MFCHSSVQFSGTYKNYEHFNILQRMGISKVELYVSSPSFYQIAKERGIKGLFVILRVRFNIFLSNLERRTSLSVLQSITMTRVTF